MSTLFTNGRFSSKDVLGFPLVGGLLYCYASGTTSLLPTYADATLTVPNSNPVTLNARGEAQIWLGTLSYTFVLRDALGVLIWTVDQVVASASSASFETFKNSLSAQDGAGLIGSRANAVGAVTRTLSAKMAERVSIADFGAVGDYDGTTGTDNTAAIQKAIAYVESTNNPGAYASNSPGAGPAELFVPAGSYMVSDALTVTRKLTIVGDGEAEFSTGSRIIQSGANKDLFKLVPQAAGSSFAMRNVTLKALAIGTGHLVNVTKTTGPGCNSQRYTGCVFANPQSQSLLLIGDDILIDRCLFDVSQFSGNCIQLGTAADGCSNVTVAGCNFFNAPTRCVLVYNVDGLTMIGNKVTQPLEVGKTDYFVDASNAAPTQVRNISLIGNTLHGIRSLFTGYNANRVLIASNNARKCGYGSGEVFPGLIVMTGACDGLAIVSNSFEGGYDTHHFYTDENASHVYNATIVSNNFVNTYGDGACLFAWNTQGLLFPNTFAGWVIPANPPVYCRDFIVAGKQLDGYAELTYAPIVATECTLGQAFTINVSDATAFMLAAPTTPSIGQLIEYTISNNTAGSIGALTFAGVFKLTSGWTQPGPGKSRSIAFRWNGGSFVEKYRTTADVAN